MRVETLFAIVMAATPFVAVGALLWLRERVAHRRLECVARQIMLTDAIHRELGAAAAPVVRQARAGDWIVHMAVPLDRELTVGTIVRIAHEVFAKLDGVDTPRLRVVLLPRERDMLKPAGRYYEAARAPWVGARAA